MGMPISSYTILSTLAFGGEDYEVNEVKAALEPFKAFAFILHDPKVHVDFHNNLKRIFDQLDYLTGDSLLFFALVDPPDAWLELARERKYYKSLSQWEVTEVVDPKNAPKSREPSLTTFALANSLGIPSSDLPCIIITDELRSKYFYKLPTDSNKVMGQLTELGYVVSRLTPGDRLQLPDYRLLNTPLSKKHHGETSQTSFTYGLARTLSDVLSFLIVGGTQNFPVRGKARNQAVASIQDLYVQLNQQKHMLNTGGDTLELENLSVSIVSALALLNQQEDLLRPEIIPVEKNLLEQDSYQILRTASKVYELLMGDQGEDIDAVLETTDDFSPGVIALSKVFEREANLSMVHWIRKQMGISLPEYYDIVQPDKVAKDGRTDFNKASKNGLWLPPGIGQSEVSMKRLAEVSLPEWWDINSYNLLMEQWAVIREKRNDAAHDRVTEMPALLEVRNALTSLAQNKCFEKFYEMKLAYSGRTNAS